MDSTKLEQLLSQIADGIESDGNWIVESQLRQGREHDERLARTADMLRRLLDMITEERKRFSIYHRREDAAREQEKIASRNPAPKERGIPNITDARTVTAGRGATGG